MFSHSFHHRTIPTMKTIRLHQFLLRTVTMNHLTACSLPDLHKQSFCKKEISGVNLKGNTI
jgi:hypothetical protein